MDGGGISEMNEFFDKYYKKYDAWYEKNKWTYLSELEAVKRSIPDAARGLEVGVGSGRFAAPLGISVGIDPSEKMVELAGKRGVDARVGRGEELEFNDLTFDYVALIVTLCFVQDPERVIYEAARVIKPGGKIIAGIIDKESSLGRSYQKKESVFYDRARFFDVKEVARMFKEAGFNDLSYRQTIFTHPDELKDIEEPTEGFGRGGFVVIDGVKKTA
jgi:SAM-dependent methyltransferase